MTTPGPWTIIRYGDAPASIWADSIHRTIAVVYDNAEGSDGRLIAAAPQLLAALKALLDLDCPSSREAARRAVAEAEGE